MRRKTRVYIENKIKYMEEIITTDTSAGTINEYNDLKKSVGKYL